MTLEGISSKRGMTIRTLAYKCASLLDSQTAHHLRVSAPGERGLCDRRVLGSFVKVLGCWSWAPGLAPRKGYLYLPKDEPLTSKISHGGCRWANKDVLLINSQQLRTHVRLTEDGERWLPTILTQKGHPIMDTHQQVMDTHQQARGSRLGSHPLN